MIWFLPLFIVFLIFSFKIFSKIPKFFDVINVGPSLGLFTYLTDYRVLFSRVMTLRASFSPFELVKNGKGFWVSFRHFHTLDKNEMTLEFLFVVFTLRIKHWNDGRVLFSFFALRIKIEKRYRVYSTLRPYSLNLLVKQRRVYFVTPYS